MKQKRDNGNDPAGQGGIVWTNEKRRLGDLIPWPRNPRQIKKAEAARLAESLDDFGQVDVFALGPDNQLYNGHQRLAVWSIEHGPDYEVDVRVSNRPLSEKERERLTVLLHRGAAGSWDFDLLANEFDADELIEWGFAPYELGLVGGDDPNAEWAGMPEFEQADLTAIQSIHVHFAARADVEAFAILIGQKLTDRTRAVWYPEAKIGRYADKRYSDES